MSDWKDNLLVTTGLKINQTNKNSTIFLGDWCLDYSLRKEVESNSIIQPYHWSNFEKLESDYNYLDILFNKILEDLTDVLNKIHNVNFNERYWRILIGPWLGYFIHGLYDKWENLRIVNLKYSNLRTEIVEFDENLMIPSDINNFVQLFSSNEWNHFCYSQIILNSNQFQNISKDFIKPIIKNDSLNEGRISLILKIKLFCKKKLNFFSQKNKVFIGSTYLGLMNEILLNFRLGQFPNFFESYNLQPTIINQVLRNSLNLSKYYNKDFELFLSKFIFRQIPSCFLEGYFDLMNLSKKLPYPHKPKVIYTANFLTYDTAVMAYTAMHVNNGTKLIMGQHGGYGIPKFMFNQDHEIAISDVFLSWGWTDKNKKNILPVGIPIPLNKYKRKSKNTFNKLILIRGLWSKYTFRIDSGSGLNLNLAIDDCIKFAKLLNKEIVEEHLNIRLYHQDHGYNERARWKNEIQNIKFSDQKESISKLVSNAKLVVYTYNISTGYLEYISANIPTIIFWNMKSSPISDDAKFVFDKLTEVGIFHNSPESAANHINMIWNDVNEWWTSEKVIEARNLLCNKYANNSKNLLVAIESIINDNLKPTKKIK